ncbi:Flp pilus assembly protein, pilin Flp [Evansella caseinilytica]|uniref:Flp pilus assembly protein, pilin Flp n=1 Tax=Evansella caseinilytica TaxID=1503961 RepID=A0A1H3QZU2_9BACI|nr:Flp pilus assembly protein, pilin Flp [Evansella caseinilytica]
MMNFFKDFWKEEEGIQTLEIMLIIAVIVVIAIAFRKQIMGWINNLLDFGDKIVDDFQKDS